MDSSTRESEKVHETTEEETDFAHLPTSDDPDDIFQNWVNSLDPEKIKEMSQRELIHMNAQIARKVVLKKQLEKKSPM